jgi:hypothetical protein
MMHRIIVGCTFFMIANLANADGRGESAAQALYFKQNSTCLIAPHCQIPASPVFPNPDSYKKLVTLTLSRGNYLVTSKLSAFPNGGTSYVNFECALLDANDLPIDFSSFDGVYEQTLFLQAPLSIEVNAESVVHIGCRAFGFLPDSSALVDMHVWNVNLAALRVGSTDLASGLRIP